MTRMTDGEGCACGGFGFRGGLPCSCSPDATVAPFGVAPGESASVVMGTRDGALGALRGAVAELEAWRAERVGIVRVWTEEDERGLRALVGAIEIAVARV